MYVCVYVCICVGNKQTPLFQLNDILLADFSLVFLFFLPNTTPKNSSLRCTVLFLLVVSDLLLVILLLLLPSLFFAVIIC